MENKPVTSIDILPTALAAAGVRPLHGNTFDGVNLLPFLTGAKKGAPHKTIYWRFFFPADQPEKYRWAIRQGDWKLVKNGLEPLALYNPGNDIGENVNFTEKYPTRLRSMEATWEKMNAEMKDPVW